MKQLLFCFKKNRKLLVRKSITTDVFVPVQDIISPQKTTLIIPKTDNVELNDIVIIRDNDNGKVEYIGYIDTLTNKSNTEISCYPLINVFDNDYVLDQMFKSVLQEERDDNGDIIKKEKKDKDGNVEKDKNGNPVMENSYKLVDTGVNVIDWLNTQLKRAFIETDDDLQFLPFIFRSNVNFPVIYKKTLESSNLFEAYTNIYINTGVYITFGELSYNLNEINGIYCDFHCNAEEKPYRLRFDNPLIQNVDIVDNTFTNYNKIIATEELAEGVTREPQRYYFYLLDNNDVSREPNDEVRIEEERKYLEEHGQKIYLGRRIKQVRSKEITFSYDEDSTNLDVAKSLMLAVYNELQEPEYNLQITITMFSNDNIKLYRRVDFVAESGIIYSSNITKIERLNDKQIAITLGALRNSLTDFKKKVEAI